MLSLETLEHEGLDLDVKIFATDADRDAIVEASAGVYAESAVAEIAPGLLSKYFSLKNGGFQIKRQVRERVVFAQHNLIKAPPFSNIDLISCRNLMIYLQPVQQKRVLDLLNFALNPQGVLFLGSSEATGEMADCFEPLDHKWRIYRSRGRRPQTTEVSDPAFRLDAIRGRASNRLAGSDTALRVHEEERLLERLMASNRRRLPAVHDGG
jgi:two-component system CheB/CheR fusion protein